MTSQGRTLPDFDNPPAVETLMGVYFLPLKNWRVPHFGLFWERIRADYPTSEVRTPIVAGPPGKFPELKIPSLEGEINLPVRCWFHNRNKETLLQVQDSCFFQNWRRESGSLQYLHYDELRPTFEREWRKFCDFVEQEGLGAPNVWRCEVTYVNHIDRGMGWNTYGDLSHVFLGPPEQGLAGSFLPTPDSVSFHLAYPMDGPEGQLQVHMQPVVRKTDSRDTIQLTVTASCRPASSNTELIVSSLNQAREWVVRGFTDFTSPKMHELWRRKI
jgi:uncharacterized protein (TIGR04255 family)